MNPTKDEFSVNFSGSSTLLSLECQKCNCSSWGLDMSRGTKKDWMAAIKYVKHLFKVNDRFIIYVMLVHAWTWRKTCWWKWVQFWSAFLAV